MFLVIGIIGTVLITIGVILVRIYCNAYHGDDVIGIGCCFLFIGGLFFVIGVIGFLMNIGTASKIRIINEQKIIIIQERNGKINQNIQSILETYSNYEQKTLQACKTSASLLVASSIFPDLKANKLFQQQIEIYNKNEEELYNCKLDQTKVNYCLWLAYFKKSN